MPAHDKAKPSAKSDLLQELRDLKNVLATEADDAIPTLSDVVQIPNQPATDADTNEPNAADAIVDAAPNSSDDGIPVLDRVDGEAGVNHDSAAEPVQSLDQLLSAKAENMAPFALIDSATDDYDTSTAESLIVEGLNEALLPLTEQMDDEALRLVDELVAEHAELIRQELTQRLHAKSQELRAELARQQGDNVD